jgi:hypothetical protein
MNFSKRKGDLPVQLEGDAMDIRGEGYSDLASHLICLLFTYSPPFPHYLICYFASFVHRRLTSALFFASHLSLDHYLSSSLSVFPFFVPNPSTTPFALHSGMMHRDGSVFSFVSMNDLKNPDTLYRALGERRRDADADCCCYHVPSFLSCFRQLEFASTESVCGAVLYNKHGNILRCYAICPPYCTLMSGRLSDASFLSNCCPVRCRKRQPFCPSLDCYPPSSGPVHLFTDPALSPQVPKWL